MCDGWPFPGRPQQSLTQAWCCEAGDTQPHSGRILCWSSHRYSPTTSRQKKQQHWIIFISKTDHLECLWSSFIHTVFIKSSFLKRILSRWPNTHSGSALPSGHKMPNVTKTQTSLCTLWPDYSYLFPYQDVDHQTGLDQLCGTPQSPFQQALRSWGWKKTFRWFTTSIAWVRYSFQ